MPVTTQVDSGARAITTPKYHINAIVEDYPKGIDKHQRYYRVIIGVNKYRNDTKYLCYRKDYKSHFVVDSIDFDSNKINDKDFIFTENEYENLLDYLAMFDDTDLRSIAEMGKKEIDKISLLPIIP